MSNYKRNNPNCVQSDTLKSVELTSAKYRENFVSTIDRHNLRFKKQISKTGGRMDLIRKSIDDY